MNTRVPRTYLLPNIAYEVCDICGKAAEIRRDPYPSLISNPKVYLRNRLPYTLSKEELSALTLAGKIERYVCVKCQTTESV